MLPDGKFLGINILEIVFIIYPYLKQVYYDLICWQQALDADLRSSLTIETDVADENFSYSSSLVYNDTKWKWVLCSIKCLFIRWDRVLSLARAIKALLQSLSLSSVSDKIKEVTSVNSASQVLQPFTKTLFKLCWVFSHCLSVVQSVYVRIHYSCHINDLFTVRMYCLP